MSNKGDYSAVVEIDDDLIAETPQLEFQDFSMSEALEPAVTGTISPGPHTNNFGPNNFAPPNNKPSSSWFSIAYFAQYFDLDTSEVVGRLQRALLFISNQERFIDSLNDKPDVYGPFWLASSMACVMFAISSLLETIRASLINVAMDYDFNQIWTALITVYSYTFGVPCLLYILSRYFGAKPVLLELVGVYGYGLISWVPVVFLCGVPNNIIRWLVVLIGTGYSGLFLARNAYPTFKRTGSSATSTGLVLFLFLAHVTFALILKIQYLSYEFTISSTPPKDATPTKP